MLDPVASHLNLVTTKNLHIVEVHTFDRLSGSISANGRASVSIDMNSINSGFPVRDQRMRELLFETPSHPTATIEVDVPGALLTALAPGQSTEADISARVRIRGVERTVSTRVMVQRLTNSRIYVQSIAPAVAQATEFDLADGVEQLRAVVNLVSISSAVPVDFAFAFDAR